MIIFPIYGNIFIAFSGFAIKSLLHGKFGDELDTGVPEKSFA